MANINQISLKVCGNPDANGGFQPMVIFNSPSIEIKDTVYAGFDANSYFFTIKIEKNQVVYKLIKNNVSSLGASRQGSLVIGIAIPKGYKLDNGITPYDVLIELKNGFLALCMTCKDVASEKYEFSSNRVQPNILDSLAGKYTLIPVQTPYHPMSVGAPIAYITATEDKIKQLMNDVQYPAFSKFGEVVVAELVQSTSYSPITNITIPRLPEYSIYDDGVLQTTVVCDPKQLLTVEGNGDSRFYENDSLMFTLEELLNGESVPNVTVDRANEIINVSSKALQKPLTRRINVVFVPKEAENYFFTKRTDWTLIYGNQPIPLKSDLSFDLTGEQLKILYAPQSFRIQQSRKDQYDAKVTSVSSNEIRITAEKVRRTAPIGGGKTTTGVALQSSNLNVCEVQLLLNHAYHRSHCSVQFLNNDDELLQSSTALFSKGTDGSYLAKVYVPKSWSGNVYVCLKYKNEKWYSVNNIGRDVNGVIELHDKDFIRKKIGFFSKYSKGIVILAITLLSLLTGAAIGAYITKNHIGTTTETISCNECGIMCDSPEELASHMQNEHNNQIGSGGSNTDGDNINETTLVCPDCGEGPFDEGGLSTHKLTCPKRVKCDKCDERFASISEMNAHKTASHDVVNYDCESCGKTFTSRANRNKHIQAEHSVKKCDVCNQPFNDNNSLKQHIKDNHHFECNECGSDVWYKTKELLDAHKKRDLVKGTNQRHRR